MCSFYTPVPKGVGPLTVYSLMFNLYKAWCFQKNSWLYILLLSAKLAFINSKNWHSIIANDIKSKRSELTSY